MKRKASDEDIHAFMAAVYPAGPDLAIAAFDERLVLQEATRLIIELRAQAAVPRMSDAELLEAADDLPPGTYTRSFLDDIHPTAEGAEALRKQKEYFDAIATITKQEYALRQCFILAVRMARKAQKADDSRSSEWNHIIRFVKDADNGTLCGSSVLRDNDV